MRWLGIPLLPIMFLVAGSAAADQAPAPGDKFRDCDDCPEMIVVPGGTFMMGDASPTAPGTERPVREVTIRAFAVDPTEITNAQFAAFVRETGYSAPAPCHSDVNRDGRWETAAKDWTDPGFPTGDTFPVTCVNWWDANAYADWLSGKTGRHYRLLSEAEYEYALRGGTTTQFWWGDDLEQMCRHANGADAGVMKLFPNWRNGAACDDGYPFLAPVAQYEPNSFGLYDMAGNAWEWTADCYVPSYEVQPRDGSAFNQEPCYSRTTRGGSWVYGIHDLRSAQRNWAIRIGQRGADVGFRVARDL